MRGEVRPCRSHAVGERLLSRVQRGGEGRVRLVEEVLDLGRVGCDRRQTRSREELGRGVVVELVGERRAARETCSRRGRPCRAPRRRWCLQSGLHPRPKQPQPWRRRTLRASARPARRTWLRAAAAVSGADSCLATPSLRIAVRNGDAPARQARPCGLWSTHGRCGTGHGHTSAQGRAGKMVWARRAGSRSGG